MTILDLLHQRASIPARYLTEPGPDEAQLNDLLKAGLSAPDHAAMRPWRFIIIEGDARAILGDVFVQAALAEDADMPQDKLDRIKEKPLRSPLIITVVATLTPEHPKTPEVEQLLSAGAAAQHIQLAATALGFGSIWLTGPNAYHPSVKAALGVADKDAIVGFIYIGTSSIEPPKPGRPAVEDHVEIWHG